MFKFGVKHPIIWDLILITMAFLYAFIIVIIGAILNLHPGLSSSIARVSAGLVLLFIYRRGFTVGNFFNNFVIVIPAFLFALWNIFYYLTSGIAIGGVPFFVEGFILAIAPALFEEVLFRGIFLYNLKMNGIADMPCIFITAITFSLVHLTNLAGLTPALVIVQLVYSLVIGLVLAAIYLKNNSLLQVILVHFLIDFTTQIFTEQTTSASPMQITVFTLVLVIETVYAIMITNKVVTKI